MASGSNVKVIAKDADFEGEVLKQEGVTLVDFGATWCGPCKALAPIVGKIADDYQGRVKVATVDIDDCPEVSKKYGIRSVPTLMVFKNGEKAAQNAGLTSRENIIKMLGL